MHGYFFVIKELEYLEPQLVRNMGLKIIHVGVCGQHTKTSDM